MVAPPAFLKTAVTIELVARWLLQGQHVLYVTGENTEGEIWARLIAHESFGTETPKVHGELRYQQKQAAENFALARWMRDRLAIISLPDEENEDPPGIRWSEVIRLAQDQTPPPLIVVDYVEEMAGRVPGAGSMTEQEKNKAVVLALKNYAVRTQSRVFAIFSVNRGSYGAIDSPFRNPEATPEDFMACIKHSGFAEYALSAQLALQYAGEDTEDDSGQKCKPMKLHLVKNREGSHKVTVPLLCYGGFCRFEVDKAGAPVEPAGPEPADLRGKILHLLAKEDHRGGVTCETVASTLRRREGAVRTELAGLVGDREVFAWKVGRKVFHKHMKWVEQGQLQDVGGKTGGEGWN